MVGLHNQHRTAPERPAAHSQRESNFSSIKGFVAHSTLVCLGKDATLCAMTSCPSPCGLPLLSGLTLCPQQGFVPDTSGSSECVTDRVPVFFAFWVHSLPHCEFPPRSCKGPAATFTQNRRGMMLRDSQLLSSVGAEPGRPRHQPGCCRPRALGAGRALRGPHHASQPSPHSTRLRTNFPNTPVLLTDPLLGASPTWRVNITCFT